MNRSDKDILHRLILHFDIDDVRVFKLKHHSFKSFFEEKNLNIKLSTVMKEDKTHKTTFVSLNISSKHSYDILMAADLLNKYMFDWFGCLKKCQAKHDRFYQILDKLLYTKKVDLGIPAPVASKLDHTTITPLMIACGHRGFKNGILQKVEPNTFCAELLLKYAKTDAKYNVSKLKSDKDGSGNTAYALVKNSKYKILSVMVKPLINGHSDKSLKSNKETRSRNEKIYNGPNLKSTKSLKGIKSKNKLLNKSRTEKKLSIDTPILDDARNTSKSVNNKHVKHNNKTKPSLKKRRNSTSQIDTATSPMAVLGRVYDFNTNDNKKKKKKLSKIWEKTDLTFSPLPPKKIKKKENENKEHQSDNDSDINEAMMSLFLDNETTKNYMQTKYGINIDAFHTRKESNELLELPQILKEKELNEKELKKQILEETESKETESPQMRRNAVCDSNSTEK